MFRCEILLPANAKLIVHRIIISIRWNAHKLHDSCVFSIENENHSGQSNGAKNSIISDTSSLRTLFS